VISLRGLDLEAVTDLQVRMSDIGELQEKEGQSRVLFDSLAEKLKKRLPGE
jgi:hypothetical protein